MMILDQPGLVKAVIQKIAYIVMIALPLVMLGLVIWGIDKGFNITDEAYYVMGFLGGQEKFVGVSVFQLLVISKLFGFLNTMIAIRILSIVLTLLSGIVFSFGFLRLIQSLYRPHLSALHKWVMGIWLVGMSFYWSAAYPLSFSYNVLINTAMLLITGLVFYMIACPQTDKNRAKVASLSAVIGVIAAIAILVKPSAILLIMGLNIALLIFFWISKGKAWIFTALGSMTVGFAAGLVLVLVGLGTITGFQKYLENGQVIFQEFALLEIVKRFIVEMLDLVKDLYNNSWLFIVTFFVSAFSFIPGLSSRTKKWFLFIFTVWLIAYLLSGSGFFQEAIHYNLSRMPPLGLFLVGICLLLEIIGLNVLFQPRIDSPKASPIQMEMLQKIAVGVCLILLPFATAMGSSNSLLWQSWLHITPWCGLVVLLIQEIDGRNYFRATAWVILIVLTVWLSARWTNIYLFKPYRLIGSRPAQTEVFPIDTPALQGIKVDAATQKFFLQLKAVISKTQYKPGDEIIAAYDSPGLVLGLGGFSPGAPWISDTGNDASFFCSQVNNTYLDHSRAIIIINNPLPPDYIRCLQKNQINFPDDYTVAETIVSPFFRQAIQVYAKK